MIRSPNHLAWGSSPGEGRGFPCPARPAYRPTQLSVRWVPGFPPGVKRRWLDADHPPLLAHNLRMGWSYISAFPLHMHGNVNRSPLPLPIFLLNLYRRREATGSCLLYLSSELPTLHVKARRELSSI